MAPMRLPLLLTLVNLALVTLAAFSEAARPASGGARSLASTTPKAPRVRKELRNLTPAEYKMFIHALSTMMTVSTAAGQAIYGPKYRELDYFVMKHIVNSLIPFGNGALGNIAHFGPWFMTFHRAFNLEWENSILAIEPDLKAMPYWEMINDLKGGVHYKTADWMYSPKWAGSKTGNPDFDYAVTDGIFAHRQIPRFNNDTYGYVSSIFSGSPNGGFLRSPDNLLSSPFLTRYDAANLATIPKPWPSFLGDYPHYYEVAKGTEMNYTIYDFGRCADPNYVHSSFDFIFCIEFPASLLSGLPSNVTDKWLNNSGLSSWTHPMFHSVTGALAVINGTEYQGDARDLGSSPNEALMFFADHANLDRLYMIWQQRMASRNPLMATPDVLWGYPKTSTPAAFPPVASSTPAVLPHCALNDVISPNMPYTDVFNRGSNIQNKPGGITHKDILMWAPDYVYDDMEAYSDMSADFPAPAGMGLRGQYDAR